MHESKTGGSPGILDGFAVQVRCVSALVIREMMTRYGRSNIGFFWVVLEPMLLTAGVMILWSLIKSPYERGVAIQTFVLTGYMPLTLWRHLTGCGAFAFRRSASLLYHRYITLFDVFLARIILEFLGTTAALTVVTVILILAGVLEPIVDPLKCVAAWLMMGALSASFGLLIAILTEHVEVSERFIQPLQYLMLPISGCFFMVEWLPTFAREVVWYIPTVHCYELFRGGWLGEGFATHYDIWYPLAWTLGVLAVGIATIGRVRDHLHLG